MLENAKPLMGRYTYYLVIILSIRFVLVTYLSLMRYFNFDNYAFDLGIFNQAFYSGVHGNPFYETPDSLVIPSGNFLGTHFSVLMFLILPFYSIHPSPVTLLIINTSVITLGGIPIWLIAKYYGISDRISLIIVLLYCFNPSILALNFYDFHIESFFPAIIGMVYYSILTKRWYTYTIFTLLAFFTFGFGSVIVFFISLSFLAKGYYEKFRPNKSANGDSKNGWDKQRNILLLTLVSSVASFYIFETASIYFAGLQVTSSSAVSVTVGFIGEITSNINAKLLFWLIEFLSLSFIPLLSPLDLIGIIPWIVTTSLSHIPTYYSLGYQYGGAFVAPFLIIATIRSFSKIKRRQKSKIVLLSALVISIIIMPLNPIMQGQVSGIAYEDGLPLIISHHNKFLQETINLIPKNASVYTQNEIFPQVSSREMAYVFFTPKNPPDYVLADYSSGWANNQIWGTPSMKYWVPHLLSQHTYGILVWSDGVILLKKGYTGHILYQGPTNYTFGTSQMFQASGTGFHYNSSLGLKSNFFYGPYVHLPPGKYIGTLSLKTLPNSIFGMNVSVQSVFNSTSFVTLASIHITQENFSHPGSWEMVFFAFTLNYSESMYGLINVVGEQANGGPLYFNQLNLENTAPPENYS